MLLSMQSLSISCYWYDRPETGRQFLDQVKHFLESVRDVLPELSILKVVRDPKESTGLVAQDFSNLDQEVIASLPKDWAYINENPKNKEFSDDCRPAISFRTAFVLGSTVDSMDLSVQVSIGSTRNADSVIIHIAPVFESEDVVRKLLDTAISFWNPHHVAVTRSEIDNLLGQAIGDIRIGWLTYFSDVRILDHHSNAYYRVDKFKSGAMVQVNALPISANDEAGIERLRRVIMDLEPTGLLRNPKKENSLKIF